MLLFIGVWGWVSNTWRSLIGDTCHSLIGPPMSLLTRAGLLVSLLTRAEVLVSLLTRRSEERRVGKECLE